MSERKYPYWSYRSFRAFRAEKRRAIREARKAIDTLRNGCAYLPSGAGPVAEIETLLERLARECSVKVWGQ